MGYWTVNTPMRPPLGSPRPYHGLHLLYTPQSEGNISIKTQPTNENAQTQKSSDTINSDSGWRVDEEKGGNDLAEQKWG